MLEHRSVALVEVQGSSCNQDGRSASFMAPNGPSQEAAIQAALALVRDDTMRVAEAHGTGTGLGDPIEVGALKRVLGSAGSEQPVAIGAFKSQMAHSEGAAGMAGLIKLIEVLGNGVLPPNLHLSTTNPKLDLEGFMVAAPSETLLVISTTCSGVSSFGYSGTNAHAVLVPYNHVIEKLVMISQSEMVYRRSVFGWWEHVQAAEASALLGTPAHNPNGVRVWQRNWPIATCGFMVDHRVGSLPVAPGTGFLQLARNAVATGQDGTEAGSVEISETRFTAMLVLDDAGVRPMPIVSVTGASVRIDSTPQLGVSTSHAAMTVVARAGSTALASTASGHWWGQLVVVLDGAEVYGTTGNDYRGEFRSIEAVWLAQQAGGDEQAAPVMATKVGFEGRAAPSSIPIQEYEQLHSTAWMDACSHAGVLADANHGGQPFVFASLEDCWLSGQLAVMGRTMWGSATAEGSLLLDSALGCVGVLQGAGLSFLTASQLEATRAQSHMYEAAWLATAQSGIHEVEPLGSKGLLWEAGKSPDVTLWNGLGPEVVGVATVAELCGCVVAEPLSVLCCVGVAEVMHSSVLRMVQEAIARNVETVLLVSQPSQDSGLCVGAIAGAWGLAQSVIAERGSVLRCVHVDGLSASGMGTRIAAASRSTGELQMVLHSNEEQQHYSQLQTAGRSNISTSVMLNMQDRGGAFSSLGLHPQKMQSPATLQVKAVGLNFRDVLNVLGMYPGDPGPPGADCAGVACPGHPLGGHGVLGVANGSLQSYAATDDRLLSLMPAEWQYEEASAMPTTWVTVWTAMEEVSASRAGCGVMIQAATGGVGLVAVPCGQRAGTRVGATAGRSEKQAYLRSLGVCVVTSSRDSSAFAAEAGPMLGTDHRVGLVLNSLSHDEYIPGGVSLLGEAGQFVEIGKRGIWSRTLMAAKHHVRYKLVAVDLLAETDPWWQHSVMQSLSSSRVTAETQEVQPLPLHVMDLRREGVEAFRVLQRASHIGKVVVRVNESTRWMGGVAGSMQSYCALSGGTGALGLLVGHWLVQHGMGELVLLSRSGSTASGSAQHWEWLTRVGSTQASVQAELCDIGQTEEAHKTLERGGSRRTGVVHSAGMLADADISHQSQVGMQKVWAPKADAGWSLHKAASCECADVQMFVLFSSIAALLGNAGQANYAAANASLDALARLRHNDGLAGISVQWGAWTGSGMAVRSGAIDSLEAQGLGPVTEEQGLCALELVLGGSVAQVVGMVPLRWPVLLRRMGDSVPRFLSGFQGQTNQGLAGTSGQLAAHTAFVASLADKEGEVLQAAVEDIITHMVSDTAGISVALDDPLMDNGIDSLAATELVYVLERELGIRLPTTLMFDYPTAAEITRFAATQITASKEDRVITETPMVATNQSLVVKQSLEFRQIHITPFRVSGMACSLAGGTQSPDVLWSTLLAGDTHISSYNPPPRWKEACLQALKPAKIPVPLLHGFFLTSDLQVVLTHSHDAPPIDNVFLRHSPLDIHIKLLLDTSLRALKDAVLELATLRRQAMGVFTGSQPSDFVYQCPGHTVARAVASALMVSGPHQNYDFACSSGYLATHHAMQALKTGQCPAGALVSGVSLLLKPDSALELHKENILSPSGMMRPFDQAADGMVWGEGSAALVLQSEPAQQDSQVSQVTCVLTKGRTVPFGIQIDPGKLMVINFRSTPAGEPNPALTAMPALKLGDRIVAIDGARVQNKEQIKEQIARSDKKVQIVIERDHSTTVASYCRLVGSAANSNNALTPAGYVSADRIQQVAEVAVTEAGIVPERLAMCHPHAMGNPKSDTPELRGLLPALRTAERQGKLVLAGHKANFGHSVCAAGLISVVMSTLALQHRVVPVHLGVTNLVLGLQKMERHVLLPLGRPIKLEETSSSGLYGSISGTALSGENVHLVISQASEKYDHPARATSHKPSEETVGSDTIGQEIAELEGKFRMIDESTTTLSNK